MVHCVYGLGLAMDNLPAKFEVPNSTSYEDTKCDAKCRQEAQLSQSDGVMCYIS